MDKVSQLLKEAKPLYLKKQREKYALTSFGFSCVLALMIFGAYPKPVTFDTEQFDSYFTALYFNEGIGGDDLSTDEVIPLDTYGLYEVI